MAVAPELIEVLVCPRCKGKLALKADGSAFTCERCRLAYAIVDDLPNFILEEAQPLG